VDPHLIYLWQGKKGGLESAVEQRDVDLGKNSTYAGIETSPHSEWGEPCCKGENGKRKSGGRIPHLGFHRATKNAGIHQGIWLAKDVSW